MNPALIVTYPNENVEYKPGVFNRMTLKYEVPHYRTQYARALQELALMYHILKPGSKTITLMYNMQIEHVEEITRVEVEPSSSSQCGPADVLVTLDVIFRVPTSVTTPIY